MPKIRVALAQVNATVGDLQGNTDRLVACTRQAAGHGARIVVFPEMMLTGYPVEDLALRASFVDASTAAVVTAAKRLADAGLGGIAVVTGYLGRKAGITPRVGLPAGAPLDAAALLHAGQVAVTSARSLSRGQLRPAAGPPTGRPPAAAPPAAAPSAAGRTGAAPASPSG
ncbi:MAG TPA: nitrilase-related carbon-nitrogen hydrolase, partial [Streptosporangiaceae bacterium]